MKQIETQFYSTVSNISGFFRRSLFLKTLYLSFNVYISSLKYNYIIIEIRVYIKVFICSAHIYLSIDNIRQMNREFTYPRYLIILSAHLALLFIVSQWFPSRKKMNQLQHAINGNSCMEADPKKFVYVPWKDEMTSLYSGGNIDIHFLFYSKFSMC